MQLTPAQVQDDLAFWLNQDREHNLFFVLGFNDPVLKREAEVLYSAYDAALRRGDLKAAMAVMPVAQAYKSRALEILRAPGGAGKAGYIWPSFVDHTKREIDMMMARTCGTGVSSRTELCFGDRMLADHAAFASHLLDPIEQRDLSTIATKASNEIYDVTNRCRTETLGTLVTLSQQAQTALDAFLKTPAVGNGSAIHPLLADHVVREGQRFQGFLNNVPNDEQQPPG